MTAKKQYNMLAEKLSKVRIMVLDGSAHVAEILKAMFDKLGFSNIVIVNNGYEGIQVMKKNPIHLMITDSKLKIHRTKPEDATLEEPSDDYVAISGLEFIKRLRQARNSPNPFVPVVMIADKNLSDISSSARDAGVNEIVFNPLNAEELCRRIIKIITDKRLFITSKDYKGPCRRVATTPLDGKPERRHEEVRIVRYGAA